MRFWMLNYSGLGSGYLTFRFQIHSYTKISTPCIHPPENLPAFFMLSEGRKATWEKRNKGNLEVTSLAKALRSLRLARVCHGYSTVLKYLILVGAVVLDLYMLLR